MPPQYAKIVETKTFLWEDVLKKYALNDVFIKSLDASIRHSMDEYWEGKKEASLKDLTF